MKLEIITIGDELLLGFTIDTNAAHLARELAADGIEIVRRATVPDEATAIVAAVGEALERTGAVVTTGGLGPTSDDLTKPAIARLFGRELRLDEEILTALERRWGGAGSPCSPGFRARCAECSPTSWDHSSAGAPAKAPAAALPRWSARAP